MCASFQEVKTYLAQLECLILGSLPAGHPDRQVRTGRRRNAPHRCVARWRGVDARPRATT